MITTTVIVLLLVGFGVGGGSAQADFVPNVTYYAPYPIWYPKYIGPPHTDYQVVQYTTSPAETAAIVKQRIRTIQAANPTLLPPKDPLPTPRPDDLPPP